MHTISSITCISDSVRYANELVFLFRLLFLPPPAEGGAVPVLVAGGAVAGAEAGVPVAGAPVAGVPVAAVDPLAVMVGGGAAAVAGPPESLPAMASSSTG